MKRDAISVSSDLLICRIKVRGLTPPPPKFAVSTEHLHVFAELFATKGSRIEECECEITNIDKSDPLNW